MMILCFVSLLPIDPPADIEQNSNNPSNTGQSSPTLTRKNNNKYTACCYLNKSYIVQCLVQDHHAAEQEFLNCQVSQSAES